MVFVMLRIVFNLCCIVNQNQWGHCQSESVGSLPIRISGVIANQNQWGHCQSESVRSLPIRISGVIANQNQWGHCPLSFSFPCCMHCLFTLSSYCVLCLILHVALDFPF
jgi:hypothetical protein